MHLCYAGLISQPKYGHFKELHAAIKFCSENILSTFPTMHSLGPLQEVIHYTRLASSDRIYCLLFFFLNRI